MASDEAIQMHKKYVECSRQLRGIVQQARRLSVFASSYRVWPGHANGVRKRVPNRPHAGCRIRRPGATRQCHEARLFQPLVGGA